jgi:hypothetical protein
MNSCTCGASLASDARFCTTCGSPVAAGAPAAAGSPQSGSSTATLAPPAASVPVDVAAPHGPVATGPSGKIQEPFVPWLLGIATCGLYYVCWHYRVNRELRDNGIAVDPAVAMLAVLVGWLLIIPPYVSIYRTGKRIEQLQQQRGLQPSNIGIVGVVLVWALWTSPIFLQSELNKVWRRN